MADHFETPGAGKTIDVPLTLTPGIAETLTVQLTRQLRTAILEGQLAHGTLLPSTRTLAQVLGVARGTVMVAYDELLTEGFLTSRVGSGTRVSSGISSVPSLPRAPGTFSTARWLRKASIEPEVSPASVPGQIDFRVGQPTVAPLSNDAWRRAWRRAAEENLPGAYADAAGDPELRAELAAYLRRSRGLLCQADDLIITNGTVQGLHLIAQAVLQRGDAVAFEEPGYRLARQVLREHGGQIVPISVDEDGLEVATLPVGDSAPLLVYTTPSHQFPLGSRLSLPRRHALLAWAAQHESLILEDDYDGEFRYDTAPLPALASMSPGQVVYLGTFSKVLSPALRIGYLVAPPDLRERLIARKTVADYHTSWPVQRALAFFLQDGDLDRHLRRMRRWYARQRSLLVLELAAAGPLAQVGGLDAGFHLHLTLSSPVQAEAVVKEAAQRGVQLTTLRSSYLNGPGPEGLLLGYGGLTASQIVTGARNLVMVLQQLSV
ncbi:PLP-dependent aminotransferase family protein [Deinococcus altitudinis]|uniref:MocR-like pyridoxine biosynthesis transcription factor PdxR n=1 Tax=Deinococcus altitudinis TaxID=468914 RepID=UPI003892AC0F